MVQAAAPTGEYTIDVQPMLDRLSDATADARVHLQGAALDAAINQISVLQDLIRDGRVSPAEVSQRLQTIRDQITATSTAESLRTQAQVAEGSLDAAARQRVAIRSQRITAATIDSILQSYADDMDVPDYMKAQATRAARDILMNTPDGQRLVAQVNAIPQQQREQLLVRGEQARQALENGIEQTQDPARRQLLRGMRRLNLAHSEEGRALINAALHGGSTEELQNRMQELARQQGRSIANFGDELAQGLRPPQRETLREAGLLTPSGAVDTEGLAVAYANLPEGARQRIESLRASGVPEEQWPADDRRAAAIMQTHANALPITAQAALVRDAQSLHIGQQRA